MGEVRASLRTLLRVHEGAEKAASYKLSEQRCNFYVAFYNS